MRTGWGVMLFWAAAACAAPGPGERREALVRSATLPVLAGGLGDENVVVRRTAVRLLAEKGAAAEGALARALGDADFLVRRTALDALCRLRPERLTEWAGRGLGDAHPAVRRTAVDRLAAAEPRTEPILVLLVKARGDGDAGIRETASSALFPFHRENVSLRHRKDYDHDVRLAQQIALPATGWGFRTDSADEGHLKGWFQAPGDTRSWSPIEVGRTWESQGQNYDGVAWYRLSFDLPSKPAKMAAADLVFDGVDEAAWVWLNGTFIGCHDLGRAGWNKAFQLDVTAEAKWGARNTLAVRVFDSAAAGGIWKPVRIEVLE